MPSARPFRFVGLEGSVGVGLARGAASCERAVSREGEPRAPCSAESSGEALQELLGPRIAAQWADCGLGERLLQMDVALLAAACSAELAFFAQAGSFPSGGEPGSKYRVLRP